MSRFALIALSLYLVLLVSLSWGLFSLRRNAIAAMDGGQAQQDWEDWRDEARHHTPGESPVSRRVPKSPEPPTLVLLRDHFATCFVGSIILSSLLYWSTIFFIRGALFGPKFEMGK